MAKKDIDWSNLGFGYVKTDKRFVAIIRMEHGITVLSQMMIKSLSANVLVYYSIHSHVLKV